MEIRLSSFKLFSHFLFLFPDRFYCDVCPNRSYKHKWHLTQHKKLECQKQAQFLCYQCMKRFTQRSSLNWHIKSIHKCKNR